MNQIYARAAARDKARVVNSVPSDRIQVAVETFGLIEGLLPHSQHGETPAEIFERMTRSTAFAAMALVFSMLASCRGVPEGAAGPTASFSAEPTTITAGQLVMFRWSTINATSVWIAPHLGDEDDGPEVPASGQAAVAVPKSATYTLTATGPGGTASRSVTVTVLDGKPTVVLTAEPAAIILGGQSTLRWSSSGAANITISPEVGSAAVPSGSMTVTPAATTTYTATATGPGGTTTAQATVTVTGSSQLAVSLTATPTTIPVGGKATLQWTSQNAVSVSIEPGIGAVNLAGSVEVQPQATTTYTATAHDAAGAAASASAIVTLLDKQGLENIKHIIFFVQENRSFDNYFGVLGRYRTAKGLPDEVDGLDLDKAILDPAGHPVKPFHQRTVVTENLSPSWNESHYDLHPSNGSFLMDRFMHTAGSVEQKYDPHGTRAMGYYDESDILYYYELATQYATSDRFYSSVLCGTICNRTFLFSATTAGLVHPSDPFPQDLPTIFRLLEERGIPWRYYYQDSSVFLANYGRDWDDLQRHVWHINNYFDVLNSATADRDLPQVVFIQHASKLALDEHPTNDIQKGVATAKKIIDALTNSAAWPTSVFILTHDEGGGLYDHVPPYEVVNPDGISPRFRDGDLGRDDNFTMSGFRVPLIVVSPWVKPHFVSHREREFTSILRLIETRFALPPLTRRDAEADDMLEFFDFSNPRRLNPPPMPEQPIACPGETFNSRCDQRLEADPNHE